uniref:MITD1 C-terminal phospholipase D-like domain-containing protein n=1 Tax=Acrobeloides nanus TaxID=290746 RepID=A0A914DR56_9BILA
MRISGQSLAIEREASETVKNQVENNVKSKEGTPYPSSSKNEVPIISFEEKLDKVMQTTKCGDLTAKVSLLIFDENVDQAIANIKNKSVPDPKPDLLSLIPKFQRYLTCSMLEASYYLRKNHLQLEDASQAYYKAHEFITNYFLNHGIDALECRSGFPYSKFNVQEKNRKMIEEEEGINWIRDYTECDDIECEEAFYDNEEILEKAIVTILKKRLAPTSSKEQKSDPVEEDETVKPETKEGSSKTTVETQMETLGLSKDEKNQPKSKSKKKKNKKRKKSENQNGADAPKTNSVSDEETDEENSENQPKEPRLEKPYKPENTTPKVVESPPTLIDPYTSDYEETLKSGYFKERLINRNETGNGFKRIFNRCINDRLTEVVITDPYVRENHQIDNFKLFCNFIAGTAKNLKKITLKTKEKEDDKLAQKKEFELIKYTLEKQYKNLTLTVEISATQEDDTHYRNFKFNNGWSLFTDRGFDMYRRVKFNSIEYLDTELRPYYESVC